MDPLATGLLIICTGKFTKKINDLQGMGKSYSGVITLGATRPSYDMETEINATFPTDHIDEELLEIAKNSFLGDSMQTPPIFSAIKVDGKKSYDLARAGKTIEMKKRAISISDFEISTQNFPDIEFKVSCSKGTYIRSLAYDFGKKVNSGAYLSKLQRDTVGPYSLSDAWELNDLIEHIQKN